MGLGNDSGGGVSILKIVGGKIRKKMDSADATPDTKTRIYKKDDGTEREVYEEEYSYVSGKIVELDLYKGEFGVNLNINMEDEGEKFILSIKFGSQLSDSFIKCLPNINLEEKVSIHAGQEKGTDKTFLFVRQDGETVKAKFTKAEPNGLPQWVKTKAGDWSHTAYDDFLYDVIEENVKKLKEMYPEEN